MKIHSICLHSVIISLIVSSSSLASNPSNRREIVKKSNEFINKSKDLFFVENKGQLTGENNNKTKDIKYYCHADGINIYCKKGKMSFVFNNVENKMNEVSEAMDPSEIGYTLRRQLRIPKSQKFTIARIDLEFANSNKNSELIASDRQEYYENFYNNGDANHEIKYAQVYKSITYKNIYTNIDMILRSNGKFLEYSFLIHPGGNIADIKLHWLGMDHSEMLKTGSIRYDNSLGNIEESAPKSFIDNKLIPSKFIKKGEIYGFKVGKYNKAKDLLIDPSIVWATYFGGSGFNDALAISVDALDNTYITGYTSSTSNIATTGAYQTTYGGSYEDCFIAKFASNGTLSWATYYGGNGTDIPYGAGTDASNNIYIGGYTTSLNGIATSGTFRTVFSGGNADAFLAKFSTTGSLLWGTYFGASGDDYTQGINVDGSGNSYITGFTNSRDSISTTGSFQTSYGGGYYDAFLAKFNSNGSLSWSTYFGDSLPDEGYGVCTDKTGDIYIIGTTGSIKGIATSGAHQTSIKGYADAYLAKFSTTGSELWSTYFGGNQDETGNAVCTDSSGNIFITGNTYSDSGLATSGAYQTTYQGNTDGFLAKFNSSGVLSWSSYFGGNQTDNSNALCTDGYGNVYIAGNTMSDSDIATSGAMQTKWGGYSDVFLARFNTSGTNVWATYFGGKGTDEGNGICIDGSGDIYIDGTTGSDSGIATSGAYLSSYVNGNGLAFLAKFQLHNSGINPDLTSDSISWDIYPNPFTDKTTLKINLLHPSHVEISILDMTGKILFLSKNNALVTGNNAIELSAAKAELSPGAYFLNIKTNNRIINKKIIVLK